MKRRDEANMLRRMLDAPVPGNRLNGRQKTKWKYSCKRDMESVWLKEEDVLDRTKWKNDIQYPSLLTYLLRLLASQDA